MLLQLPGNQQNTVKDLKDTLEFFEEWEKRKKKDEGGRRQHNFTFLEQLILTIFFSIPVGLISAYTTVIMMRLR